MNLFLNFLTWKLEPSEAPDPPQEVKMVEFDGRSTKVTWSPPFSGNSPITSYTIQYKPEGEKWSGRETINLTVSGSENFILIRGLKPVSIYHARVFASNNLGKSDPSETIHLRTDEEGKLEKLSSARAFRS